MNASLSVHQVAVVAGCAKRDIGSSAYSKDIHGLQMPPEVIEPPLTGITP